MGPHTLTVAQDGRCGRRARRRSRRPLGAPRRAGREIRGYNRYDMSKEGGRAVLVVEDDVSVRRPLVKFLEMHGFAVATAETADEGLDALKKQKFTAAV